MVYAMLMGIADKVAPQIKELYPEVTNQLEQYERRIRYVNYYNGLLYRGYANERRRQEMARSSGSVEEHPLAAEAVSQAAVEAEHDRIEWRT